MPKDRDQQQRQQWIEEALRWYAALRAGVGDGVSVVHNIRESLRKASAGVEVLLPAAGNRDAEEVERELQECHDRAIYNHLEHWKDERIRMRSSKNATKSRR